MKEQKIIVQYAGRINETIDPLLNDGWRITQMLSEVVSHPGNGGTTSIGRIIILLEKCNFKRNEVENLTEKEIDFIESMDSNFQ